MEASAVLLKESGDILTTTARLLSGYPELKEGGEGLIHSAVTAFKDNLDWLELLMRDKISELQEGGEAPRGNVSVQQSQPRRQDSNVDTIVQGQVTPEQNCTTKEEEGNLIG